MKNQPVYSNSGTLEDIVFENRNKAYGAFDLNKKNRKYLMVAFFISLLGVTSAIAVPFIRAFHHDIASTLLPGGTSIEITKIDDDFNPEPVLPPPPATETIEHLTYAPPLVVEEVTEDEVF